MTTAPAHTRPSEPSLQSTTTRMPTERPVHRPHTLAGWWERFVARPELHRVIHLHAPVALAGGHTPVEIVASGVGVLFVDGARHLVVGVFRRTLMVRVQPRVVVRFVGVTGAAIQELSLASVVHESPRRIVVASVGLPLIETGAPVVRIRAPQPFPVEIEGLAPARAQIDAIVHMRARVDRVHTRIGAVVDTLAWRTRALSFRIRLPGGPDDAP